jgi:hypothetical protein
MSLTAKQARQKRLRRAALKVWLLEQAKWDGVALINCADGKIVSAEIVKAQQEQQFAVIDSLPRPWRELAQEYGAEILQLMGSGLTAEQVSDWAALRLEQIRGNA